MVSIMPLSCLRRGKKFDLTESTKNIMLESISIRSDHVTQYFIENKIKLSFYFLQHELSQFDVYPTLVAGAFAFLKSPRNFILGDWPKLLSLQASLFQSCFFFVLALSCPSIPWKNNAEEEEPPSFFYGSL